MSIVTSPIMGYCMKCTVRGEIQNIRKITLKNGRPAIEGICPVCDTRMFKIGGAD